MSVCGGWGGEGSWRVGVTLVGGIYVYTDVGIYHKNIQRYFFSLVHSCSTLDL